MRSVLNLFHFDGMFMGILQCQNTKESLLFVCMIFVRIFNSKREMVLLSPKMTLEAPLGVSKL